MFRSSTSVVALCAALLATSAATAADYDNWGDAGSRGFREGYATAPADWSGLGDNDDPIAIEFGVRYWYSWGTQELSSAGASVTSTDTAHIGELHLRIDDHSTNVYAKALAGYSMKLDGTFGGDRRGRRRLPTAMSAISAAISAGT